MQTGITPLHWAARGALPMHPSIVSLLVDQPGIDFNAKHTVRRHSALDPALPGMTTLCLTRANPRPVFVQLDGRSMTPLGMAMYLKRTDNEGIIRSKLRAMGVEAPTP